MDVGTSKNLKLPRTAILNNLEYDHADIYPDVASIRRQFNQLLRTVPASGRLIVNGDDAELRATLEMGCWTPRETFGAAGGGALSRGATGAAREGDIGASGADIKAVNDELFPSGPWVGFYQYVPRDKHRMDLHLEFSEGRISGDGNDDVGAFLIRGDYDPNSRECRWIKAYLGGHQVYYRGFRENTGIWGTWEINVFARGGFHIWPRNASAEAEETTSAAGSESVVRPPEEAPKNVPAPASASQFYHDRSRGGSVT
jgi:hypothetical protein